MMVSKQFLMLGLGVAAAIAMVALLVRGGTTSISGVPTAENASRDQVTVAASSAATTDSAGEDSGGSRPAAKVDPGPGVGEPGVEPRQPIENDIGMAALEEIMRKLGDPESPISKNYLSLPQTPLTEICGKDNVARLTAEDRRLLEERELELTRQIQQAEWQGAAGRWSLVAERILEGRDRTLRTSGVLPQPVGAGTAAQVGAAKLAELKQIMNDIPVAPDDKCYMSIGGARPGESRVVTFTRAADPGYFELKEAPARLRVERATRLLAFMTERGYIAPDPLFRR